MNRSARKPVDDCEHRAGADWLELRRPRMGASRGPWRPAPGDPTRELCELPLWLPLDGAAVRGRPQQLLDWALAPAVHTTAEAAAAARRAAPPELRTILAGPVARTIELQADDAHLSWIVVLAELPAVLDPRARSLARSLVCSASAAWRLVRIDWDDRERHIRAEIDLTGAPAEAIEPLSHLAVGVLRNVASATAATLEAVLDPSNPVLDSTNQLLEEHANDHR
ncbi:MAG TPA: hypothetical protein VF384_18545 [Planctomycetota bacterium]